jgi:hypothetical protein
LEIMIIGKLDEVSCECVEKQSSNSAIVRRFIISKVQKMRA